MRKLLVLAGLLALVASPGYAAPQLTPPSFDRAKSLRTGRGTNSIAVGDLNGDGRPDLVTTNVLADTVSVLLNRGDGGFQARADYKAKSLPASIAVGDLSGDGKPDLAFGTFGGISLRANRGDGTFGPQVKLEVPAAASVAIGDLDSDGRMDLVTAGGYAVYVLSNRGDGTFDPVRAYQTGTGPESIAAGDLNGDGSPDLATANVADDTVSVLLNRGDGTFQPKSDYGAGIAPLSIAIGDLNGDLKPDLAAANGDTKNVSVFLNKGDATFRLGRDYGAGGGVASVAIGDLNGDAKPDLAIASGYRLDTVSVLANSGDGRFEGRLDFGTGRSPYAVAIADLNGDGRPDLATANYSKSVSVLTNTPGLCTVQNVVGRRLAVAKRMTARATCLVGKVTRSYSKTVKRGRVISQKPKFGAVLRGGGKVDLVVSRGRNRS